MKIWRLLLALFCGLFLAIAVLIGFNPERLVKAEPLALWLWKAGGWIDYAPNGVPDFDQKQSCWGSLPCPPAPAQWTYCGPVAAANSLWWFDSKLEPSPQPPTMTNDNYFLITTYQPWKAMGLDDHDPVNVGGLNAPGVPGAPSPLSLVDDLAWYFDTDGLRTGAGSGTTVQDMFYGLQWWLYGGNPLWGVSPAGLRAGSYYDDYHVQMVKAPDWEWVVDEVERSEDVILLLGFWQEFPAPDNLTRLGGHYVTVAGINDTDHKIAFSDPFYDNAEAGGPGRVRNGTIPGYNHTPIPGHPTFIHNDAGNLSHDEYTILLTAPPVVDWAWEIPLYAYPNNFLGQNTPIELGNMPPSGATVHTFVEYAIAVSPFTWKPGGEWVHLFYNGEWIWEWWSFEDDGDSCMPDFSWSGGGLWPEEAYDGPTALSNSLWWFDSKAETLVTSGFPVEPPAVSDHYPLVASYGAWDDHDIPNTHELIDDLASHLNTDADGTNVADMAAGIQDYLEATGTDVDFYTKTQSAPSFNWVADEVIACEDVLMLLGFYEDVGGTWERKGGHWVDAAGVSKESHQIGLSDPWWDHGVAESFFDVVYTGRVFPPEHLYTAFTVGEKQNPQSISHDIYEALPSPVTPYQWALEGYPVEDITGDMISLNGGGEAIQDPTNPLTAVVEWAIGVSPYADLVITKTALVTEFVTTGPITYVIQYTNTGLASVNNVLISDTPPSGVLSNLSFIASPPLIANPGPPFSWIIPKLSYGQGGVITVTAVVKEPLVTGAYTNTVTISIPAAERSPSNNSSQAIFWVVYRKIYLPIVKK